MMSPKEVAMSSLEMMSIWYAVFFLVLSSIYPVFTQYFCIIPTGLQMQVHSSRKFGVLAGNGQHGCISPWFLVVGLLGQTWLSQPQAFATSMMLQQGTGRGGHEL
jgi:hypothetical protein